MCKLCGVYFKLNKLKYSLSIAMILETDKILKNIGVKLNIIDRIDLKHKDTTFLYLPHRVCEEW